MLLIQKLIVMIDIICILNFTIHVRYFYDDAEYVVLAFMYENYTSVKRKRSEL